MFEHDISNIKVKRNPLYKLLAEATNEQSLTTSLSDHLPSLVSNKDYTLSSVHNKKTLGVYSPDWLVTPSWYKGVDSFWYHIVGDSKSKKDNDSWVDDDYGQVLFYMKQILKRSFHHGSMYGFLISQFSMKFFKATLEQSSFKVFSYPDVDIQRGIKMLKVFIDNQKNKLDPTHFEEVSTNNLKFLAYGRSSQVFNTQNSVFKFYMDPFSTNEMNNEIKILKQLEDLVPNVPLVKKKGNRFIELTPFGKSIQSPCTNIYFISLFETIKKVHEKNIIHRDLRVQNLIESNGNLVIIDWANAVVEKEEEEDNFHPYFGTLYTAADQVLESLKNQLVRVTKSNDLESIVKTIILLKERGFEEYICINRDPESIKRKWNETKYILPIYSKMLKLSREYKINELIQLFEPVV